MKSKIRSAKRSADETVSLWKLGYLDVAEDEGRHFLSDDQYAHAVQLFDELALEDNPLNSDTLDIRSINEFYELRDKGGILGKINLRVYFALMREQKLILVLSVYKKEREGSPPRHIMIRLRNRLRRATTLLKK